MLSTRPSSCPRESKSPGGSLIVLLLLPLLLLCLATSLVGCSDDGAQGDTGAPGPVGPPGSAIDDGTSAETCLGCHGPGGVVPVVDIRDTADAHYVDTDPDGPLTASGYRQLNVSVVSVDVTGAVVEIVFDVTDEAGSAVGDIYASDGRFALARLMAPTAASGGATQWETLLSSERFTTSAGVFAAEGAGRYRYTSAWSPTSAPLAAGETLRLAVQISARDLPPGNGICDFDANLAAANDCTSPVSLTRDIVRTPRCNSCHGVTPETELSFHGGGRTEVEYCVVCHNPDLGEADFSAMTHRIHAGSTLPPEEPPDRYAHVEYTRDLDDCTSCHGGGGVDEDNWSQVPTRAACGSCHGVDFQTGANHGSGGVQLDDSLCLGCHPAGQSAASGQLPIELVHRGAERNARAALYRGAGNGHAIESLDWDADADTLSVRFSVTRDGQKLDLATAPEYPGGGGSGRVNLKVGWSTVDYTNEGSGSAPAPAQPLSYSGTDFSVVTNVGGNVFERIIPVPDGAFDTVAVAMEGYPATNLDDDLDGIADDAYDDALPVRSVHDFVHVEDRGTALARRTVVDIERCNACHDAAGAGISLHGSNRTSDMQACVVCHNADATDIARRPADPAQALDGKREEAVDMKRMIHQIHAGDQLDDGVVIYGFGGTAHEFSDVGFIGNLANCETCHVDATPSASSYGAEAASQTLATTIDTGAERSDPSDDLNISPQAAVCASCHDGRAARTHMILYGASFMALDADIR